MSVCLIFRMCAVTMPMDPLYAAMAERYPDPKADAHYFIRGRAGYLLFIEYGDNRTFDHSGRILRRWHLVGLGDEDDLIRLALYLAGDCVGGNARFSNSPSTQPEALIAKVRATLKTAVPLASTRGLFKNFPVDVDVGWLTGDAHSVGEQNAYKKAQLLAHPHTQTMLAHRITERPKFSPYCEAPQGFDLDEDHPDFALDLGWMIRFGEMTNGANALRLPFNHNKERALDFIHSVLQRNNIHGKSGMECTGGL